MKSFSGWEPVESPQDPGSEFNPWAPRGWDTLFFNRDQWLFLRPTTCNMKTALPDLSKRYSNHDHDKTLETKSYKFGRALSFQLVPMWWRCVMCRSFGLKGQLKKVKQWREPTLERTVCTKSNNCKRNRSSRYKFVEMGHFCIYPRSKKFVSLLCVWWDLLDPRPYRGIPGTV